MNMRIFNFEKTLSKHQISILNRNFTILNIYGGFMFNTLINTIDMLAFYIECFYLYYKKID